MNLENHEISTEINPEEELTSKNNEEGFFEDSDNTELDDNIKIFFENEEKNNINANEIACKLIDAGEIKFLANILPKLKELNADIAIALEKRGCYRQFKENIESFNKDSFDKESAKKMIKEDCMFMVADNLDCFHGLDQEIAIMLIEGDGNYGWGHKVAESLYVFENSDHNKIVEKMVEKCCTDEVMHNFRNFKNLNEDTAILLIGKIHYISDGVFRKIRSFDISDHNEFIKRLIKEGYIENFAKNIEVFENLDIEIARELVKAGLGSVVARHFSLFKELDEEIFEEIFEPSRSFMFMAFINKFGILGKKSALMFIEAGDAPDLVNNINKFKSLDKEVAMALIKNFQGNFVLENPSIFTGLNIEDEDVLLALKEADEQPKKEEDPDWGYTGEPFTTKNLGF